MSGHKKEKNTKHMAKERMFRKTSVLVGNWSGGESNCSEVLFFF